MTLKEFLHRFVIVHKCAGCSEILEYERSHEAFCPTCKLAWRSAMTEGCRECFKEISECSCMPKPLSKAGALTLRSLCFYSPELYGEAQNKLIYRLKTYKNKRYSKFVAEQMRPSVIKELKSFPELRGKPLVSSVAITYVPRGKRAVIEKGFDQSELICEELSKNTGIPCIRAIKRSRSGKVQKSLTKAERFKNTEKLFELDSSVDVGGKYVILFDDVVTTGASMTACTRILRKAGAKGVLCFCIAKDKLKRKE